MKSLSAVINARIQSTRVPRKLVRPFAGTTLLDIALAKLDRLDFVDHRYLAVADEELMPFAERYPQVELLRREPDAVKKGVNPQHVTFAHYLKVPTDYILVVNPCLPFVSVDTLRRAHEYFQNSSHASYTSAVPTGDWVFDEMGNALTNADPLNLTTNKNVKFFKAAHAFHIVDRRFFATHGHHWTFARNDPHLIQIPEEEAVDVDTEVEFEIAEALFRRRSGTDSLGR